jgi:hypothetical protein
MLEALGSLPSTAKKKKKVKKKLKSGTFSFLICKVGVVLDAEQMLISLLVLLVYQRGLGRQPQLSKPLCRGSSHPSCPFAHPSPAL